MNNIYLSDVCEKADFVKLKQKFSTLKFCCCKQHSRYENINETL